MGVGVEVGERAGGGGEVGSPDAVEGYFPRNCHKEFGGFVSSEKS